MFCLRSKGFAWVFAPLFLIFVIKLAFWFYVAFLTPAMGWDFLDYWGPLAVDFTEGEGSVSRAATKHPEYYPRLLSMALKFCKGCGLPFLILLGLVSVFVFFVSWFLLFFDEHARSMHVIRLVVPLFIILMPALVENHILSPGYADLFVGVVVSLGLILVAAIDRVSTRNLTALIVICIVALMLKAHAVLFVAFIVFAFLLRFRAAYALLLVLGGALVAAVTISSFSSWGRSFELATVEVFSEDQYVEVALNAGLHRHDEVSVIAVYRDSENEIIDTVDFTKSAHSCGQRRCFKIASDVVGSKILNLVLTGSGLHVKAMMPTRFKALNFPRIQSTLLLADGGEFAVLRRYARFYFLPIPTVANAKNAIKNMIGALLINSSFGISLVMMCVLLLCSKGRFRDRKVQRAALNFFMFGVFVYLLQWVLPSFNWFSRWGNDTQGSRVLLYACLLPPVIFLGEVVFPQVYPKSAD